MISNARTLNWITMKVCIGLCGSGWSSEKVPWTTAGEGMRGLNWSVVQKWRRLVVRRCFDDCPAELSCQIIFHWSVAVQLVVPFPVNQRVEKRLEGVQNGDDVPAYDDDSDWQVEPHRPHQNRVHDIRQPANVKNHVDQRELDLEHVVDLSLVVRVLSIALNQLSINLFATLHVNQRVCNHHKQDWPVVENVVRHDSIKRRRKIVNVMTAERMRFLQIFKWVQTFDSLSIRNVQTRRPNGC